MGAHNYSTQDCVNALGRDREEFTHPIPQWLIDRAEKPNSTRKVLGVLLPTLFAVVIIAATFGQTIMAAIGH